MPRSQQNKRHKRIYYQRNPLFKCAIPLKLYVGCDVFILRFYIPNALQRRLVYIFMIKMRDARGASSIMTTLQVLRHDDVNCGPENLGGG